MTTTPLLSIGMIFKNEERCIERCLKSLAPLRKAIPCELIMADTGAEDASREIAERYADLVIDFPWVNDFSAARNAVMDRCSGKWYLTVDCDEWLDPNLSELITFLREKPSVDFAFVIQRNYFSENLEESESYSDFQAMRLTRLAAGHRYFGAIHESWPAIKTYRRLSHTILHHDGYFFTDPKQANKKTQRNMQLLRQKLAQNPEDLGILCQCIESATRDADFISFIRRGVEGVKKKWPGREIMGACIMRHAVEAAYRYKMPELEEWINYAEKEFPNSIFTRIDLNYTAFFAFYDEDEWGKATRYGESYCKGIKLIRTAKLDPKVEEEMGFSSLRSSDPIKERSLQIALSDAYRHNKKYEKSLQIYQNLDGGHLQPNQVRNAIVPLGKLHAQTKTDVSPALITFYEQIEQNGKNEKKQKACLAAFNTVALASFTTEYQKEEADEEDYFRPAYTVFACLADRCEAGRGAKIMMADDPAEMRSWLEQIDDWQALPIEALEHALKAGVPFPLADKPLPQEVLDGLASRLTHDANTARQIVLALPEKAKFECLQSLYWVQTLILAALHSFDWSLGKASAPVSKFACPAKKKDEKLDERPKDTPEVGLALVRRFVQVERALLPLLYAPALLSEENAALLPPMHRWGLYCAKALDALDGGNPQEYLAILRRGLTACPGQKEMVQFLLDRFLEDARPKTSPELLILAEKIRAILAAYSPDDPAVRAIRESPAYKQVAWIIEPPTVTVPQ